jgi:hypothetical protein
MKFTFLGLHIKNVLTIRTLKFFVQVFKFVTVFQNTKIFSNDNQIVLKDIIRKRRSSVSKTSELA